MPPGKTTIYVASAGTGKTTTLMDLLTDCLEDCNPGEIVFTTFTKSGATEAINRALTKNPNYEEKDFTGFSTLHAYCYRRIPRKQMLNFQDYKLIGQLSGYPMTGNSGYYNNATESTFSSAKGDRLLHYHSLMRNMNKPAEEVLLNQIGTKFTADELNDFDRFYREFRTEKNKYDFTDHLEVFLKEGVQQHVKYLFVDEAQDLSPLQWQVIDKLAETAEQIYIAGDDKQSIYKFSGGDPKSLIERQGTRIVLDTSYRLPSNILNYAEKVADRIEEKQEYEVVSKKTAGNVHKIRNILDLDFSKGTWLLLARNKLYLNYFEALLTKQGIIFISSNEDSQFNEKQIQNIKLWEQLRRGYKLPAHQLKILYRDYLPTGTVVKRGSKNLLDTMPDKEMFDKDDLINNFGLKTTAPWHNVFKLPEATKQILLDAYNNGELDKTTDIEITTIHSSKGREADNVVILPDMTQISYQTLQKDPDNEHRVFYVGCTRAKENLYLHSPITQKFYPLP
jgi:DNA helicase-2/ATP-dependent DNA helicase PcrA